MDKYCYYCGNKIDDNADICLGCGRVINQKSKKGDKVLFAILSFLAPIVSIVLYFVLKQSRKVSSRVIIIGILIRILVTILLITLAFLYFLTNGFVTSIF